MVTVEVYERDNTLVGTLSRDFDRKWFEELNGPGTYSFNVPIADPDGDNAWLEFGRIVKFRQDGNEGGIRFAGFIETKEETTVSRDDEVQEVIRVSGPGLLAILEDAIVHPELTLGDPPGWRNPPDTRRFDWTAPGYVDTAWGLADESKIQGSSQLP